MATCFLLLFFCATWPLAAGFSGFDTCSRVTTRDCSNANCFRVVCFSTRITLERERVGGGRRRGGGRKEAFLFYLFFFHHFLFFPLSGGSRSAMGFTGPMRVARRAGARAAATITRSRGQAAPATMSARRAASAWPRANSYAGSR